MGLVTNGRHPQALARAIDAVLAQSMPHWELLVLHDGPGDRCAALVASYADARLRYVRSTDQLGPVDQLELLCRLGRGAYVGLRTDAQLLYPDHLRRLTTLLQAYPRAVVAHS